MVLSFDIGELLILQSLILFIGPTEICVRTMIFFFGFIFFACFLVHYVNNKIPNEVRKSCDTSLNLMLINHVENK